MVLLIIIPFLNGYFIGNIPYFQTNPYGMTLPLVWHRWPPVWFQTSNHDFNSWQEQGTSSFGLLWSSLHQKGSSAMQTWSKMDKMENGGRESDAKSWDFRGAPVFGQTCSTCTKLWPKSAHVHQRLCIIVHLIAALFEHIDRDWIRSSLPWVISHVPMFHITQPLGINGLLDGYYKVMSNIPKMGHLPIPAFALASAFAFAPAFACVSAQYLINLIIHGVAPKQVLHQVSNVLSALVRRVAYAPPWLQITMQINILQILSLNSRFLSSLATGSVASFAPTQTSRTSCSFLTAQHRVSHMSAPPSLPFGWHGTQISPWRIKSVVGAAPYFSLVKIGELTMTDRI